MTEEGAGRLWFSAGLYSCRIFFISATMWGWHVQSAIFKWAQTNSRGEDHRHWRPRTSVSSGFPVRQLDSGHFYFTYQTNKIRRGEIADNNLGDARGNLLSDPASIIAERPNSGREFQRCKKNGNEVLCLQNTPIRRFSPWLSGSTIKITKGRSQVALTSNLL